MAKINIGKNIFVYPNPVTLLGTVIEGKPNFMALGWISRANTNPPLIAIGVGKSHYTPKGIVETKTFSINYPSVDMVKEVDYCGLVTGKNTDKSSIFDIFYGELGNAPMVSQCPLCMECTLLDTLDYATNYLFVGEIVAAYADEQCLTEGKPDIKKINPLLLTMPDNSYWTVGDYVGQAWGIGKQFKGNQQ